jgi:NDP-sugar pyrophosphorylase family protein
MTSGAIIAAGEGSRLRSLGLAKPLVPVAGEPLVARVLENFAAAGIVSVAVIFNANEEDCAAFVRRRFGGRAIRVLVKTTASSLESFQTVLAGAPPGTRAGLDGGRTTAPRDDFSPLSAPPRRARDATVLAVTPLVADEETTLWVRLGAHRRVTEVGGSSGDAVTAGMYAVSQDARDLEPPPGRERLRDFLAWLCASGHPMSAVSIPRVVDVDTPEDLRLAEELARDSAHETVP